jgi:hypothetical protein
MRKTLKLMKERNPMKLRSIIAFASALLIAMVFAFGSGAGVPDFPCPWDADGDGVCDLASDNCLTVANPSQVDGDSDGYGNACDTDINNNCTTGLDDTFAAFGNVGAGAPWSPVSDAGQDINENGTVGLDDVFIIFGLVGSAPGPSAQICASCPGTPAGACP